LSARSPYFWKKLVAAPETVVWRLPSTIPEEAFQIALRYLYLGDVPSDLGLSGKSFVGEEEVLMGIDKVSKHLEIESLWEGLLSGSDRRLARQRHQEEVTRGRDQIESWYRNNVLKHKMYVDSTRAAEVKWTRDNGIFADVLLRADAEVTDDETDGTDGTETPRTRNTNGPLNGIPIGPSEASRSSSASRKPRQSVLFPVHRAMLLRSEYFQTMFTSSFQEAQTTEYLHIVTVDCSPAVLQIVLDFIYTEKADIPIELALDVLFAADMLFIEKLKTKATIVISTIGNGPTSLADRTHAENEEEEIEPINIYDVIRAGWFLRVQRLEEFSARYLAYRLEDYIDEEDFEELVKESAQRIEERQETDTIELLDEYVPQAILEMSSNNDPVSDTTSLSDSGSGLKTPVSRKL
jgi:ankyrin repeat/BTB/POZ domain-containing protein 1